MPTEADIEIDAKEVLRALAARKNVIIAGPPGTGKSRLLNSVRNHFVWDSGATGSSALAQIPIPAKTSPLPPWFPSPDRTAERAIFQTVFDQNTKYRDFMRGLVPKIGEAGAFIVTKGTFYRASIHAREDGNAALVIIDEINRGPAVAAFGSALVGLEADKRLGMDGKPTASTQLFELLGDQGGHEEFALPADLYVLAAMNEADTSVEPLDVAFLRRFHIHRLEPSTGILREHLGLPTAPTVLPETPGTAPDFYEAVAQAFEKINAQILLGRGQAYQLGHGALMFASLSADIAQAQEYARNAWATLRGHVDEVFFGNTRALADILRAESPKSIYSLEESTFAGQSVRRIIGPVRPTANDLYKLLRVIATE